MTFFRFLFPISRLKAARFNAPLRVKSAPCSPYRSTHHRTPYVARSARSMQARALMASGSGTTESMKTCCSVFSEKISSHIGGKQVIIECRQHLEIAKVRLRGHVTGMATGNV